MNDFKYYNKAFGKLKRRYAEEHIKKISNGQPHKPFLLLAVIDLIQQGEIIVNIIELDEKLRQRFSSYWEKLKLQEQKNTIQNPFEYLKNEESEFWNILEKNKKAEIDKKLFDYIQDKEKRESLRRTLIETYFRTEIWTDLWENVFNSNLDLDSVDIFKPKNQSFLPTKEDCDTAIKRLSTNGQAVSEEEIIKWISEYFNKQNKPLENNWEMITKRNLELWGKSKE